MLVAVSKVVWGEIETADPVAFQRFHAAMWGRTFRRAFEDSELDADYWLIRAGERVIGGLQRAAASSPPPQVGSRLYVGVDDLEQALDRFETLGGRVERRRTGLGGDDRWYGTALDPTGISFGLWTQRSHLIILGWASTAPLQTTHTASSEAWTPRVMSRSPTSSTSPVRTMSPEPTTKARCPSTTSAVAARPSSSPTRRPSAGPSAAMSVPASTRARFACREPLRHTWATTALLVRTGIRSR